MDGTDPKIRHLSRESQENELQGPGVMDRPTRITLLYDSACCQTRTLRCQEKEASPYVDIGWERPRLPEYISNKPQKHASTSTHDKTPTKKAQCPAYFANIINIYFSTNTRFCGRSPGPMDTASASGAEDSRFESWGERDLFQSFERLFSICLCIMFDGSLFAASYSF